MIWELTDRAGASAEPPYSFIFAQFFDCDVDDAHMVALMLGSPAGVVSNQDSSAGQFDGIGITAVGFFERNEGPRPAPTPALIRAGASFDTATLAFAAVAVGEKDATVGELEKMG